MEVKDVLENYTNLEKECESAKQTVSIELQVSYFSFNSFDISLSSFFDYVYLFNENSFLFHIIQILFLIHVSLQIINAFVIVDRKN